jgi:copper(I)-binding protein
VNAEPVTERRFARRVAAVAAAAGTLLTAGCAAGQDAQTAYQKPTLDGTLADVGNLHLRGVSILPPSGTVYRAGSSARMRLVIVNSGAAADRLTSVTSARITTWAAFNNSLAATANVGGSRTVAVPPGVRTSFGVPETRSVLLLRGLKAKTFPGTIVRLTFTFARAGTVTVPVPVQLSSPPGTSTVPEPSVSALR